MTKLWGLLRSMVSGMPGASASPAARTQALVQGARSYLAQGHEDYLKSIVQGNRAQVCTCEHLTPHEFPCCRKPHLHSLVSPCTTGLEGSVAHMRQGDSASARKILVRRSVTQDPCRPI